MLKRVPTIALDVALALLFVGVNVLEVLRPTGDGVRAGATATNLVVLGLFAAFLVLRRRAPVLCWVLMHAEFVLSGLVARHSGFAFGTSLPACLATYTVARYAERRWAPWALLSGPLLWVGVLLADGRTPKTMSGLGFFLVSTIASWGAGRLLGALAERAAQLELARDRLLAERSQREQAVVREERARIALEMHDVVALTVSRMVRQLELESDLLAAAGDDVSRLTLAHEAGRQAMAELRRTMGVLRPDEPMADRVPTLADATGLVDRCRAAGVEVLWRDDSDLAPSEGVSFAAYRILQEALTNALKHGDGGPVTATLSSDGDALVVAVRNRPAPLPGPGAELSGRNGLVGMRERVAVLGGTLQAGVRGGEFEVRAVLPTRTGVLA